MPMQRERYPAEWEAISLAIRERAGNKCEWCNVPNGAVGARDRRGEWHDAHAIEHMNSTDGEIAFGEFPRMVKIILTVAHLGTPHADGTPGDKHDKMDCRPENLAALCQRCHLNYDRDEHMANAARTRLRKKQALYVPMFEEAAE
jgi:hypothetical protein